MRAERAQRDVGSLWLWPVVSGAAGLALALLLLLVRSISPRIDSFLWPGDTSSATAMAQTVAGSVVTVTSLTFTLTVVALQLASQQFSPRLLREFSRDPVTKVVLSVLIATFVVAITVLRGLREDRPVPALAVAVVFLLGLISLGTVVAFISHLIRVLRVDTMMLKAHTETVRAIGRFYPDYDDSRPQSPTGEEVDDAVAEVVPAWRSGFVQLVEVHGLVAAARDAGVVIVLIVRPGDQVVEGSPVATVQADGGGPPDPETARACVRDHVRIGYERTLQQDAAFGFRQLEDIAVKALSPGINDPVTAIHAVGHLSDLLVSLTGRRLGPTVHLDDAGAARAVVPDRDLDYYLELTCGQIRRYGKGEPTVLIGLLRMLRDVAVAARDDAARAAVRHQVALVVAAADPAMLPEESEAVSDMAARVAMVLEGRTLPAYIDRSGETRSV